jgi:cytochrome c oxidase subunit 2
MNEPNHLRRFGTLWIVSSVIVTPLVVLFVGPKLPPGKMSVQAAGQVTDNTVLTGMATPVFLLVVLYLIYAAVNFRQAKGAALEGPAVRGDARVQTAWVLITSGLVLILAVYGTVRLLTDNGAGSGSGPNPVTRPSGPLMPVQVIGQQWQWTFRWPTYGGVETTRLELPVDTNVEFNVTSLDVIHSFWAYQLGVKADANPQVNNIAFVEPKKLGPFEIRCAELCGIWHGDMFGYGSVVSHRAFESWIHAEAVRLAPATKALPPYSKTYLPEPARRGG